MEKATKTSGRRKNAAASATPEMKAAPAGVESKQKLNGTTEKSKDTPVQARPAPAPTSTTAPVAAKKPAPEVTKAPTTAPAAAPQPARTAPATGDFKPIAQSSKTATIEAKIDVGFGNTLYLRGEGVKGADWNRGVPLKCVDDSTWQWSGEAEGLAKVKLLLNDTVWAQGEDLVIKPGQKIQISPSF